MLPLSSPFFFFFNDTATTEIYTLSLHDALPISPSRFRPPPPPLRRASDLVTGLTPAHGGIHEHCYPCHRHRSEEHTSELQSPCNLVCRLLLEKKKKKNQWVCACVVTVGTLR